MAASGLAVGRMIFCRADLMCSPCGRFTDDDERVVENFNHPVSTLIEGLAADIEARKQPRLHVCSKNAGGRSLRPMAGAHAGLGIEAMQS